VLQELDSKGWCYGTEDQIEADKVWQRCAKKAREALAAPEPTLPDSPLSIASNPPPSYPPQAIRQGHHGTAILVIDVGVDGVPTDVQVEQTSGFRELDKAAIDAAQKWRFNPEVRNGQKVEGQARTPFAFN
jgi:protein TonB